jgi:hypothetical protein
MKTFKSHNSYKNHRIKMVGWYDQLIQASTLTFVLYQWKLSSDKYILDHGCPTGQVKLEAQCT